MRHKRSDYQFNYGVALRQLNLSRDLGLEPDAREKPMQEIHSPVRSEVCRPEANCQFSGPAWHMNETYLKGTFHSKTQKRLRAWLTEVKCDCPHTLTPDSGLILGKYAWFGLCGAVVTSAYESLPDWLRTKIGGRYHFCFHVLMDQLSKRLHSTSRRPPFMVFERRDKVIGRTLDAFVEINKDGYSLGSIVFDTKENVPMLQTADFLVYEINRWLDEQIYLRVDSRVQIRKLAAQGKNRYEFLPYGYHDEETLSKLVARLEGDPDHEIWVPSNPQWWPDSWYPNYVKSKPNAEQKHLRKTLEWNQSRRTKKKK